MLLYLTRHGQTEENTQWILQWQLPGTLSELWHQQAELLAERLSREDFDAIYCSDLQRVRQTAEYVLRKHTNIPVIFTPELQEKNIGSYAGLTNVQIAELDAKGIVYDDGESEQAFYDRAGRVLKQISAQYTDEKVLVLAHAAINRMLIAHILGQGLADAKELPMQSNAALTVARYYGRRGHVILSNDISHLTGIVTPFQTV